MLSLTPAIPEDPRPDASLFHFGMMSSTMHIAWVRYTCGRLKSDYRYSKDIVYNNYPWPESPTAAQKSSIEKSAQMVLDARATHTNSSLADLYDPLTMPPTLTRWRARRVSVCALSEVHQPTSGPRQTAKESPLGEG